MPCCILVVSNHKNGHGGRRDSAAHSPQTAMTAIVTAILCTPAGLLAALCVAGCLLDLCQHTSPSSTPDAAPPPAARREFPGGAAAMDRVLVAMDRRGEH